MAMKRGASKPSIAMKLRNIGSTAPSVKGADETKKVVGYKPNGGYFATNQACCYNCDCSKFEDGKVRGHCRLIEFTVSQNGLCNRFKKPQQSRT